MTVRFPCLIELLLLFEMGNRKIVKKHHSTIVKKPHSTIVKKPHSTIVKLFPDKFKGSRPYSTIVKKVHSHTVQLSKKSQMIFTGKFSRL